MLVRLEAEYYALRKLCILSRDEVTALPEGSLREDLLTLAEGEGDGDDPEPSRTTLSVIEQRIEQVLAETPPDGLDEDDLKIRKVRLMRSLCTNPGAEPYARLLYHLIWFWQPCGMPSIPVTTAL